MKCITAVVRMAMMVMALATLLAGQAFSEEAWWEDSLKKALRDGYRVVNQEDLEAELGNKPPPLLLDVRPDYEFQSGHIPGSSNLEFDLGDKIQLNPEKKQHFQEMAGPDKGRSIIIYCRSIS